MILCKNYLCEGLGNDIIGNNIVFGPKLILREFKAMNNVSRNDALICRGIHRTMYLGFFP